MLPFTQVVCLKEEWGFMLEKVSGHVQQIITMKDSASGVLDSRPTPPHPPSHLL